MATGFAWYGDDMANDGTTIDTHIVGAFTMTMDADGKTEITHDPNPAPREYWSYVIKESAEGTTIEPVGHDRPLHLILDLPLPPTGSPSA